MAPCLVVIWSSQGLWLLMWLRLGVRGRMGFVRRQANDRPRPWFLARTAGMAAGGVWLIFVQCLKWVHQALVLAQLLPDGYTLGALHEHSSKWKVPEHLIQVLGVLM